MPGLFQGVFALRLGDYRLTLLWAGCLFLPAAFFVLPLPDLRDAGDQAAA